jgi:DNA-binding NtrC family response regulator
MDLHTQSQESTGNMSALVSLAAKASKEGPILIVSDDDAISGELSRAFREAGLVSACARSMSVACGCARSGRFPVVFTTPVLADGSWRRLADIASQYDLGFVVVLVAPGFDFNQYSKALEEGAFDVVDALHELPQAADAARRALWAAYLKGAGPCPDRIGHRLAA